MKDPVRILRIALFTRKKPDLPVIYPAQPLLGKWGQKHFWPHSAFRSEGIVKCHAI